MTNPKYPYQKSLFITYKMANLIIATAKAKGMTQGDYYRKAIQVALDKDIEINIKDDFNTPEIWTIKTLYCGGVFDIY